MGQSREYCRVLANCPARILAVFFIRAATIASVSVDSSYKTAVPTVKLESVIVVRVPVLVVPTAMLESVVVVPVRVFVVFV